MRITVNERPVEIAADITIRQLLEHLQINPRQVAVERNLELVPQAEFNQIQLQDNDELEIVTLMGGG